MKNRVLFLFIFSFIPAAGIAGQYECDKATADLKLYLSYWETTDTNLKLDAVEKAITDFQVEKQQFDSNYFQYMNSDFILHQAYFASNLKTLANSIQSLISAIPGVNAVTAGAIDCSAAMLEPFAEGLVTKVIHGSMNVNSMTREMTREGVKCGAAAITDEFGAVASFSYTLYQNLERKKYLSTEHKQGVEDLKIATDRLDGLIQNYQKTADYHKYMLLQHRKVKAGLENNKIKECQPESTLASEDEPDDLFGDVSDELFDVSDDDLFSPTQEAESQFDFVAAAEEIKQEREQRRLQQELENQRLQEAEARRQQEDAVRQSEAGESGDSEFGFGDFMTTLLGAAIVYEQLKNGGDVPNLSSGNGGSSSGRSACIKQIQSSKYNLVGNNNPSMCFQARETKRVYSNLKGIANRYCRNEPEYRQIHQEADKKIRWANNSIKKVCTN